MDIELWSMMQERHWQPTVGYIRAVWRNYCDGITGAFHPQDWITIALIQSGV